MSNRRRPVKKYSDPYKKNRPRIYGQGRCRNRICSAAVWQETLNTNLAFEHTNLCKTDYDRERITQGLCSPCIDRRLDKRLEKKLETSK